MDHNTHHKHLQATTKNNITNKKLYRTFKTKCIYKYHFSLNNTTIDYVYEYYNYVYLYLSDNYLTPFVKNTSLINVTKNLEHFSFISCSIFPKVSLIYI